MNTVDKDNINTWLPYRDSFCTSCKAECCTIILEVKIEDLVRLNLCSQDEALQPKKVFKRLQKEKVVKSYREGTGLFTLQSKSNGDCQYLDSQTRLCTVYDLRPNVCRNFPLTAGPRLRFCPASKKKV